MWTVYVVTIRRRGWARDGVVGCFEVWFLFFPLFFLSVDFVVLFTFMSTICDMGGRGVIG